MARQTQAELEKRLGYVERRLESLEEFEAATLVAQGSDGNPLSERVEAIEKNVRERFEAHDAGYAADIDELDEILAQMVTRLKTAETFASGIAVRVDAQRDTSAGYAVRIADSLTALGRDIAAVRAEVAGVKAEVAEVGYVTERTDEFDYVSGFAKVRKPLKEVVSQALEQLGLRARAVSTLTLPEAILVERAPRKWLPWRRS